MPVAIPIDVALAALAALISLGVSPTIITFLRSDSLLFATHVLTASSIRRFRSKYLSAQKRSAKYESIPVILNFSAAAPMKILAGLVP
jgi:hypothetical protein